MALKPVKGIVFCAIPVAILVEYLSEHSDLRKCARYPTGELSVLLVSRRVAERRTLHLDLLGIPYEPVTV